MLYCISSSLFPFFPVVVAKSKICFEQNQKFKKKFGWHVLRMLCCCYAVAMLLLCGCYVVATRLLCYSYRCCAVAMRLLYGCYAVAIRLLCGCYVVAMRLLCYSCCCYVVAMRLLYCCYAVAMLLLLLLSLFSPFLYQIKNMFLE